ncbi:MAG: phosphotransferase [Hominenteromicrobium sp.]
MDQKKIGLFIAEKRKEKKYLQKDIAARLGVSEKTISKWECGNGLPEIVYMEPLCQLLGITVNELLAGENIPILEILRQIDKSSLELVKQLEFEQMKMRLFKLYDFEIDSMEPTENGAGGLTYFVVSDGKKYVVKYSNENDMNHVEIETAVCDFLLKNKIPACVFLPNKRGKYISTDENGRKFTVQKFYDGITYDYHAAPQELQRESALMLARIHRVLQGYPDIPTGIGADFFKYRKTEYMSDAYAETLNLAVQNGDFEIAERIRSNMRIIDAMPAYEFDVSRFTCGGTHGDYMISQMIWKNRKIIGIIDWTCVCKHPYIWEIVRSYLFMAPEVKQGEVDIDRLIGYLSAYTEESPLSAYDIENAGTLFFYFLAVCNFYGQYYDSLSKNRRIFLEQANMSADLLIWFEKHIDELNRRLRQFAAQIKC